MEIGHKIDGHKGVFYISDGKKNLAEMTYSQAGTDKMIIDHTEVGEELKGQGAGKKLVHAAVEYARQSGMKIIPLCPFAKSVFDKTPEFADVLA